MWQNLRLFDKVAKLEKQEEHLGMLQFRTNLLHGRTDQLHYFHIPRFDCCLAIKDSHHNIYWNLKKQ